MIYNNCTYHTNYTLHKLKLLAQYRHNTLQVNYNFTEILNAFNRTNNLKIKRVKSVGMTNVLKTQIM